MSMEITSWHEPESGTWTYLLADTGQRVAAVIDPVWVYNPVSGRADCSFIDRVLAAVEQQGLRLEWVLETHAHADHLTAAGYIREKTGARLAIGRGICSVQQTFVRVFNLEQVATDGSQFDRLLAEGDVLPLGSLEIRVLETPGHTSDSITYVVGDAAFIGDTLFNPTHGSARCDFPGGDPGSLYDSIQKIYALPEHTRLFLCHDYPASGADPVSAVPLAESRKHNIHVNETSRREEFIAMRQKRDAGLPMPRLILPSLQVNIQAGSAPQAERNGVSYLKIPFNQTIAGILKQAGK